jgi:hypothetical protein
MKIGRATVKVTVEVEVRVEAELATDREVERFAAYHREEIEGATARALERDFAWSAPSVGWLETGPEDAVDREVVVMGVNTAEPVASASEIIAAARGGR